MNEIQKMAEAFLEEPPVMVNDVRERLRLSDATCIVEAITVTAGPLATWLWLTDLSNIQETIVRAASGDTEDDTE